MKYLVYFLVLCFFGFKIFSDLSGAIAFGLTLSILIRIIVDSNETFVFREWVLFLYALNYLLSPAITYQLESQKITNIMKIDAENYFSLAFPGFMLFAFGIYLLRTSIFKPDFKRINKASVINERLLINMTLFAVICRLTNDIFSSDFHFFIYLLSSLRFVGLFALYASKPEKYKPFIFLLMGFELFSGFRQGMFHDALMWTILLAIFYIYIEKPNIIFKLGGAVILIIMVLFIQAFKADYRERVWVGNGEANIGTIQSVGSEKANSEVLVGEDNLLGTLNRGNQAWIFASTVDNMDRTKDFQGVNNVSLYLESAFLPRFLAPDKITAGNRLIFNRFSGHEISEGTSMGLGVYADGYIAYGKWGVYIFNFFLGLLFSLTFRIVQSWSKISPFYILLILPILNYAVRPDCELQTTINHLSKSIIVFGGLVYLTKFRFTIVSTYLNKQ